jgi:hypothetical protein
MLLWPDVALRRADKERINARSACALNKAPCVHTRMSIVRASNFLAHPRP